MCPSDTFRRQARKPNGMFVEVENGVYVLHEAIINEIHVKYVSGEAISGRRLPISQNPDVLAKRGILANNGTHTSGREVVGPSEIKAKENK